MAEDLCYHGFDSIPTKAHSYFQLLYLEPLSLCKIRLLSPSQVDNWVVFYHMFSVATGQVNSFLSYWVNFTMHKKPQFDVYHMKTEVKMINVFPLLSCHKVTLLPLTLQKIVYVSDNFAVQRVSWITDLKRKVKYQISKIT